MLFCPFCQRCVPTCPTSSSTATADAADNPGQGLLNCLEETIFKDLEGTDPSINFESHRPASSQCTMSQNSRPGFKSKLPRPVVRPTRHNECNASKPSGQAEKLKKNDLKTVSRDTNIGSKPSLFWSEASRKPTLSHSDVFNGKMTSDSVGEKKQINFDVFPHSAADIKTEMDPSQDEFQADPKALESILSNKGVTTKLLSTNGSSTSNQTQTGHRSSLYYQPSSRLSMIDSHAQFQEKLKLLNKHLKTLNIKCGGTPKSGPEQKANTTSSSRPISLYHQMKPLQKKPTTPTPMTPVESRLYRSSLSERKLLCHRDLNNDKLSQTTSKLNTKSHGHMISSSTRGKENRVRFKLFDSPIHEVTENTSHGGEISAFNAATAATKVTKSQEDSDAGQGITIANKDSSSFVALIPKDPGPHLETMPTTCLSFSNHANNVSGPPVMSAFTSSTWSFKNSVCTPKSSNFTPVRILPKTNESITPNGQLIRNRDSPLVHTPSRVLCNNESPFHKLPQRIAVTVTDSLLSQRRTPQRMVESVAKLHTKSPMLNERNGAVARNL